MIESTCSRRDAASVIFNLPDHHVIDAVDLPSWGCRVITQADSVSDGCSDCGVVSERVHAWCRQRVKDIPHTDGVELILAKPRLVCGERACPRRTFTQTTPELPLRARCTSRLRRGVLETRPTRCWCRGRIWDRLVDGPQERQRRRRRAAWRGRRPPRTPLGDRRAPLPSGPLVPRSRHRRVEPWMTALVNAASGQVLGIVDGRGSAAVTGWLGARSQAWRDRIQVVAIDPSAAFRKAITTALPHAHIAVDPFHLVQLANLCLTRVRHHLGRQGRPPARPGQHHPRQGSHRQGPTPRLGARQPTPRKPAGCGTR